MSSKKARQKPMVWPQRQGLDNQDVCLLLQISKRTLQTYRNNGTLPYSMLNNKCYYKAADIAALLAKSQVK